MTEIRSVNRRTELLPILFLVVAITLFFSDILFLGREFCFRDILPYFYPIRKIVHDVVASGSFPLWNRAWSAGQPIAANPAYQLFYPLQWITLIRDFDLGFRLYVILHFHIAALGMYFLLRDMSLTRRAATFGAFTFAFGGPLPSLVNTPPLPFAWAWIPVIVMAVRRYIVAPSLGRGAVAVLVMGLQLLAAEPVTILETWFVVAALFAARAFVDRKDIRTVMRHGIAAAAMFAAAILVAAVQILPAIDHVRDSARGHSMPFAMVAAWSMPPRRILELLIPSWMGSISTSGSLYWGANAYSGLKAPYLLSIYVGLAAIVFAIAGVIARRPWWRAATAAVVSSYILALGSHTPLLRVLYDTGVFRFVRYPEKLMLFGLFAVVVFASMMLDRIIRGDRDLTVAALRVAAVAAGLMVVLSAATMLPRFDAAFGAFWDLRGHPLTRDMAAAFRASAFLTTARCTALAAIVYLCLRGRKRAWILSLALFAVIDLVPVAGSLFLRVPSELYTTPPPIVSTFAPEHEKYRIFHAGGLVSSPVLSSYFLLGEPVYWIARNGLYPRTPSMWGLQTALEVDSDGTSLQPTAEFLHAAQTLARRDGPWRDTVMAMSNVAYVGRPVDLDPAAISDASVAARSRPAEFARVPTNPRYYFADTLAQAEGEAAFVHALASREWSPRVAFVSFAPFAPAAARVVGVTETANDATIDVDASGRAFLVMSVTSHKYWRATIDGAPGQLERVNLAYQGISVPEGKHRIEMKYRNPLVAAGGLVSLIAIAVCLAVFLRRSGHHAEGM